MVPARNYGRRERRRARARRHSGEDTDVDVVPADVAEMQPLSGYDVGEVPFIMQAVCYYEETLDVGMLETALQKTLRKYPMLAGRLV